MRHERQGKQECQLATLAMLADIPLTDVRWFALSWAGVNQWLAVWGTGKFWPTVSAVKEVLGLNLSLVNRQSGSNMRRGAPKSAELSGRGQLSFRQLGGAWHAVAYEDGVVYDPVFEGPMPVATWMQRIGRKWLSYYLSPLEDQT